MMLFSKVMSSAYLAKPVLAGIILLISAQATAGISIGGTRIIYPAGASVSNIKIMNSSDENSFLIQSWVEDGEGNKTKDFVVTPPLYVSGPKNENSIRIMHAGKPVPQDKESLYYFVSKAIPSMDKNEMEGKNVMMLTAANRIKLFVRPAGLKPDSDKAPQELSFSKVSGKLEISNPTPYFITATEIKAGTANISTVMIPPKDKVSIDLPAGSGNEISFRTINDQGATTPAITKVAN